jgi:hypothetical protein
VHQLHIYIRRPYLRHHINNTRCRRLVDLLADLLLSSTPSFKFFSSSHKPNPDREDSVWDEPEAYSAVVTRKEHPSDPTALLSLREVL